MGGGGTTIQAPKAPDYGESTRKALEAQIDLAPEVFAQESEFQPKYATLRADVNDILGRRALQQAEEFFPRIASMEAGYNDLNRKAELQQLTQTLPQYTDAFASITPGYKEALGSAGQLAQQSMERSLQAPELAAYEQGVAGPSSGQYLGQVGEYQANAPLAQLGQTAAQAAGSAGPVPVAQNMQMAQSANAAARSAGRVPDAVNMPQVAGPQLQSGLQNIDQGNVSQYVSTMPGMGDYAQFLAANSRRELEAGKGLTEEEQRIADQSVRAAYAARGTALGNQAVGSEILNRASTANQRYQQRLSNATSAAGQIQNIYQPALAQSLQRQQAGLEYGLGAQGQAFGQAQARDTFAQQLQAQRYGQAMGTQGAGFGQAQAKDAAAQSLQAQRYQQAMGAQGAGYEQLMNQESYLQGAQAQAFGQAMGREELSAATQQQAFNQALARNQAQQQRLQAGTAIQAGQAQLGSGALGMLQQAQAPVLQAFYKQPILQGQSNFAQQMGLNLSDTSGPQLFNPESQTAMGSIYGAFNTQANLAAAQAQANAGSQAGTMGMIGSIGGGLLAGAGMAF